MVAILVLLTILVALAIDSIVLARHRRLASEQARTPVPAVHVPQPPQGVFVDAAHTWLRIHGDGRLRVGLDDLLAEALGAVERVDVLARGTFVERGQPLIRVRVNGRTLVLPSPASGEVMAANDKALRDPAAITQDPYGAGWIVSLWTRDHHAAIAPLRIGASASAFLRNELQRLADFLTPVGTAGTVPVMADGGLPARGAVAHLSDADWASFQEQFVAGSELRQ